MFSADLSWTEPGTEKIGERRERIAKERSTPSAEPSISSSPSSRASESSIADERELWWASSIRKARNLKPAKLARPSTSLSTATQHSRKPSAGLPRTSDSDSPSSVKDPSLHPAYTYLSTLSSTLPSGAPLDPLEYEVPELEGDLSSRATNSSVSRSSHERRWSLKHPHPHKVNIIDEVHEAQPPSTRSLITRNPRRHNEAIDRDDVLPVIGIPEKHRRKPFNMNIEGAVDELKLRDQHEEISIVPPSPKFHRPYANGHAASSMVSWRPPSDWNIIHTQEAKQQKELPPTPVLDGIEIAHSSLLELTRFQRFIRRMESAGPKVILDRLKEEWDDPVDPEAKEEVQLEKRLWVLTAFQLQNLARLSTSPQPRCHTGKILELYGNLGAEVYQLSAMHPRQKVQYLTTEPQRPMPLPVNVSYVTVPEPDVPCPWPDATFSHIRASTLPSLVPSSKLPQLLRECHRLLAPGGLLEIRIMDAAPVRRTAGPKMRAWIEDRLSLNLEKTFRCSKPCMLIPGWVADAGFDVPTLRGKNQVMRLPCAFDGATPTVDEELKMLVGRALWKDIWGSYVDDVPNEPQWWWEDDEIVQECLQHQTAFDCGSIFAYKI